MAKVGILTDSNSGITQAEAKEMGVHVLPMPFYVNDELFYEEIDLSQEQFYEKLMADVDIKTSMPVVGELMDTWQRLLEEYDEIIHIPMSSGLSGACAAAATIAEDFDGKVHVVDNQRISVTLRQSVRDAKAMADAGMSASDISAKLMDTKLDASIYIMVDTLYYLKKGGRLTPAAAALGTLLHLKPVLQIQGEKLDSFAKARTVKQAKTIMMDAIEHDMNTRFAGQKCEIAMAYTYDLEAANEFKAEVEARFPGYTIHMEPLSLSVSCHIGPGALAVTVSKVLDI